MRSIPDSRTEEYLVLAIKVIRETASALEKAEFGRLLKDRPELEVDYQQLRKELLADAKLNLAELFLKALTKTASTEERVELRSLLAKDPAPWRKCLEFAMTVQVIAESLRKARTSKPTPAKMPEHVREKLLASLRGGHRSK